jgi:hypothetical protein
MSIMALAILVVFGIAYGKLSWKNRLLKKQEGEDEERQVEVEESQRSGQMVETRKSQDIPFGVRAIQSGIQVDGIWISKDSTPMPASLKLGHMRSSSSDRSGNQNPSPGASPLASPRASVDSSQGAVQSPSSRGRTLRRESDSETFLPDTRSMSTEVQDVQEHRPSYKPRRASHLRYDSYREANYNEYTLDQLEGKASEKRESAHQKRDGTREMENDQSSGAAADNERSSGSETDVTTLSGTKKLRTHDQRQSLPIQPSSAKSLLEIAKVASGRPPRASLPPQISEAEYLPVPLEPSKHEKFHPLTTSLSDAVDTALPFKPPYARTAAELTASGESQVPLLSHSRSPSPFIPGELHMNKSVRKVNSGFEVLPAGTFGVPSDFMGKGVDRDDDLGEKRQSKLRKKIRTSTSSRRPSGAFESP